MPNPPPIITWTSTFRVCAELPQPHDFRLNLDPECVEVTGPTTCQLFGPYPPGTHLTTQVRPAGTEV